MSAASAQVIPLLLLRVAGLSLSVPTTSVSAVERWTSPIGVPLPREHVLGFRRWRGNSVPVLDLAGILGHRESRPTLLPIVEVGGAYMAFPIARVESMPSLTLEDFVHSGLCELSVPSRFVRAVGHADEGETLVLNLVALHDAVLGHYSIGSSR